MQDVAPWASMSVEEARSILVDEIDKMDLESGSDEDRLAKYESLTPRQQAAMEMDRWNSTGGTRNDSAGVEISYEYTIRTGTRYFRDDVEGTLDASGRFVPLQ